MPKVDQDTVLAVELPIPPINDQRHLVTQVARNLSVLTSLSTAVDHALVRSTRLRRSILDWAFSGQLVPQEPSDEPATKLLTQIVTERSTFPSRRRKTYE
jgi:type I restriction enzyme S subunit